MSGGAFDYNQNKIGYIHEEIQEILDNSGKERPKDQLGYNDVDYFDRYPEELLYPDYSEEVKKIFTDGIEILKKAEIYAQRIDWYLSGDDGEDSFRERLKEDLLKLKQQDK